MTMTQEERLVGEAAGDDEQRIEVVLRCKKCNRFLARVWTYDIKPGSDVTSCLEFTCSNRKCKHRQVHTLRARETAE